MTCRAALAAAASADVPGAGGLVTTYRVAALYRVDRVGHRNMHHCQCKRDHGLPATFVTFIMSIDCLIPVAMTSARAAPVKTAAKKATAKTIERVMVPPAKHLSVSLQISNFDPTRLLNIHAMRRQCAVTPALIGFCHNHPLTCQECHLRCTPQLVDSHNPSNTTELEP